MLPIYSTYNLHKTTLPPPPVDRTYVDVIFSNYTKVNVEYAPGFFMDIYLPIGDTKTDRACVVCCHAGGGIYSDFKQWPKYWGSLGYVGVSIDYGPTEPYSAERQRHNVTRWAAAVRFLKLNAATYGIDPAKLLAMGVSAGALTSISGNVAANDLSDPYFDTTENLLYLSQSSSVLASATLPGTCSPIFNAKIDAGDAENHFYHGTLDPKFPYADVQTTFNLMIAAGIPSTFMTFVGATHDLGPYNATIKADLIPKFAAKVV